MEHFPDSSADASQRLIPAIASSPADDRIDVYTPGTQQRTERRAKRTLATTKPSLRVALTGSAVMLLLMLCHLYFAHRSSLLHIRGLGRTAIHDRKSGAALNDSWSASEGGPEQLQPLEYTYLPAVKPSGNWTCVLLHGLGDHQASDSFRLRQALLSLSPALFEPMAFIIPVADTLPVSVFAGQPRSAWFDIRNWTLLHQHEDLLHMHSNVRRLTNIIIRNKLDLSRTIIAGFSQGAVMSLLLGLTLDPPPAGLIMLSGFLPMPSHLGALFRRPGGAAARSTTRLHWLHGQQDPYFPLPLARHGFQQLRQLALFPPHNLRFSPINNLDHRWSSDELRLLVNNLRTVVHSRPSSPSIST